MNYQILLDYTAKKYLENTNNPSLSKTKLLKLTYIIEYYYYKKTQTKLTDATWIFLYYGPYIFDYDEFIKHSPFYLEEIEDGDYKIVMSKQIMSDNSEIDDFDIKQLVKNITKEYGKFELNEILDFIYFDTEPMANVHKRFEKLDFSTIPPEKKVVQNKLTKVEIKSILGKYKERMPNARRI